MIIMESNFLIGTALLLLVLYGIYYVNKIDKMSRENFNKLKSRMSHIDEIYKGKVFDEKR